MARTESFGHGDIAQGGPRDLLGAARALLRGALPPHLQDFAAAIPETPPARALAPRPLPVLAWRGELENKAAPETRALTAAVATAAEGLAWGQTYRAKDISEAFLARYGWCELLGQRGHFASEAIALGVLLLGPETAYPLHRHEAEEVYLVLSGTAGWRKGAAEERLLPPGSVVHHPAWTPHAMRAAAEPLLALYLWRGGDLVQKSQLS